MLWRLLFQFQRYSPRFQSVQHHLLSSEICKWKMPFYAVARGRSVGIYNSWGECESQVKGFKGARYKKFDSPQAAQDFIACQGGSTAPSSSYVPKYSAGPSKTYNNNLKRSYSTSSYNDQNSHSNNSSSQRETSENEDSDDADDINDIIIKQMDDIEKRVNKFSKGIDKIYKKSAGSVRQTIMIEPPQPKRGRLNNREFRKDNEGYVQVYTDGACSANGQKGARAGLGVYWGDGHELNTSEPVSGRATNNCGEIQAATCAIRQAIENGVTKLAINTDSQFLINSVTKWIPGWKRKGWRLQSGEPVKNEKDFKELDSLQNKLQIKWNYVEAHKGIHGNEMADQLARAGAAMYDK